MSFASSKLKWGHPFFQGLLQSLQRSNVYLLQTSHTTDQERVKIFIFTKQHLTSNHLRFVDLAVVVVVSISGRSQLPNLFTTVRRNILHNMATNAGEVLNLMAIVILTAYIWYARHNPTSHHHKAQEEAPEATEAKIKGAKCEKPKPGDLHIEDDKTEEIVARLIEKAMQPVVQWHDVQKRADEAKIRSLEVNQHAMMERQNMFERVTDRNCSRIRGTQTTLEDRLDQAEERARTAARKELIYKHQREVEQLRGQLRRQQKQREKVEARIRQVEDAMSKVLDDAEDLPVKMQEESQRRMEVEDKARTASADVARLMSVAEDLGASLEDEKRRHKQTECDLAKEKETTSRLRARVSKLVRWKVCMANDHISRHAVQTFKLHPAKPKTPVRPKSTMHGQAFSHVSSLEDVIDRLSDFSITNSQTRPIVKRKLVVTQSPVFSQQGIIPYKVVIDQPPIIPQQVIVPNQVVIDQSSTVSPQFSLYPKPVVGPKLVSQLPPIVNQQLTFHQQPVMSSQPLLRPQPIDERPNVDKVHVGRQDTVISKEQVVDEDASGKEEPTSDREDDIDQQVTVVQQGHVEEREHAGDQDIEMKDPPLVRQVAVINPATCAVMEPAVIQNQIIAEEPVGDEMSFKLQQTGHGPDSSMTQGHDVGQASLAASVEPKTSAAADSNFQQPFRFHFSVSRPGLWMAQSPRYTSQAPFNFALAPSRKVDSNDTFPDKYGKSDMKMTTAHDQSSVGGQVTDTSLEHDEKSDVNMDSDSTSNSLISELEHALTAADAEERERGMASQRDPTIKAGKEVLPAAKAPSDSTIEPVSGSHSAASPDTSGPRITFFGARHLLPIPRGKKDRFSKDQIEKMMSKASEAPPLLSRTLFSSDYLAQLRAQMMDFSTMKKVFGDEVFDDDDWISRMRQEDLERSEVALCNMSEETRYAVPPYTNHTMEQMMESLFIACIWNCASDEFDFDEDEGEKYLDDFMKVVKEYLRTHPADTSLVG